MTPIEQAAQALREAIIPCLERLQPTEHALAPTLYEQMAAHNALNIARAALASLEAAKQEPLTDERPVWRCFHCDEVFTSVVDAAFHFGYADLEKPACLVDAVELRNMQLELRRYRDEDSDLHRALHAKDSAMQQAVMRAEEEGYARGLADARKNPEELGLAAAPSPGSGT